MTTGRFCPCDRRIAIDPVKNERTLCRMVGSRDPTTIITARTVPARWPRARAGSPARIRVDQVTGRPCSTRSICARRPGSNSATDCSSASGSKDALVMLPSGSSSSMYRLGSTAAQISSAPNWVAISDAARTTASGCPDVTPTTMGGGLRTMVAPSRPGTSAPVDPVSGSFSDTSGGAGSVSRLPDNLVPGAGAWSRLRSPRCGA
nr:hypothetical protein [Cryobacterium sp.]